MAGGYTATMVEWLRRPLKPRLRGVQIPANDIEINNYCVVDPVLELVDPLTYRVVSLQ